MLAREIDELRRTLPQRLPLLLEDRELSRQRDALGKRYGAEEELEVAGLRARAEADGFGLVQIDAGQLSHPEIVPVKDGQPVPLGSLRASLSPEEFAAKGARLEALGDELRDLGRASRDRQRRFAAELRELVAAAARSLADEEIGDIGRHVPDLALGAVPGRAARRHRRGRASSWPTPDRTRWSASAAGSSATASTSSPTAPG